MDRQLRPNAVTHQMGVNNVFSDDSVFNCRRKCIFLILKVPKKTSEDMKVIISPLFTAPAALVDAVIFSSLLSLKKKLLD